MTSARALFLIVVFAAILCTVPFVFAQTPPADPAVAVVPSVPTAPSVPAPASPMLAPPSTSAPTYDWSTLLAPLVIGVLVPIVVMFIKKSRFFDDPDRKMYLPMLAIGVSVALSIIATAVTDVRISPLWMIVLGLAGSGLREVQSQLVGSAAAAREVRRDAATKAAVTRAKGNG